MGDKGPSLQKSTPSGEDTASTSPKADVKISLAEAKAVQTCFEIQKLPAEILFSIAGYLDIVSRACLKLTNTYLWDSIIDVPKELSPCARARVRGHLARDRASSSEKVSIRGNNGYCEGYAGGKDQRSHCEVCRCDGHMDFCKTCGVRTCARENELLWER